MPRIDAPCEPEYAHLPRGPSKRVIAHAHDRWAGAAGISAAGLCVALLLITYAPTRTTVLEGMTTLADGLKILDVSEGGGAVAQSGDKVKVHYSGKLTDGTVFDSGDISFIVGQGQVL